jgi:hypothetical protein
VVADWSISTLRAVAIVRVGWLIPSMGTVASHDVTLHGMDHPLEVHLCIASYGPILPLRSIPTHLTSPWRFISCG